VAIGRLLEIMRRLRDPERGCPWDREQTWESIAPHTIEEAYELEDAIRKGDPAHVQDELGDLLFQVVCQARIAEEAGVFAFDDVVDSICDKLERRHPHVFGEARADSAAQVSTAWEAQKARERAARGGNGVLDKLREELAELDAALASTDRSQAGEELGDLLFTAAQLARHLELDPETCLRSANRKFEERFGGVEQQLAAEGRSAAEVTPVELERLWERAKRQHG